MNLLRRLLLRKQNILPQDVTSDTGTWPLVLVCLSRNTEKDQNSFAVPTSCPRLSASLLTWLDHDQRVTRNRTFAKQILIFSYINSEVKHSSNLGTPGCPMVQSQNYLSYFMVCGLQSLDPSAAIMLAQKSVTMTPKSSLTRLNHLWILQLKADSNPALHYQIRLRIAPYKAPWISSLQY